MNKKYIIANIRMPVELLEDGTITNLTDRASIELEYCKELPSIQQNIGDIMNINNIKRFIEREELSYQNKMNNDNVVEELEIKQTVDELKVWIDPNEIKQTVDELKVWIDPNEIKPSKNKYCNITIKNIKPNKLKRYSVKNIHYSNTN